MAISTRFSVAVHILAMQAKKPDEKLTSDIIAASVSTNPAVIRRIMSMLSQAGFIQGKTGPGGGTRLAMPAGEITLWDVFMAVEGADRFTFHKPSPSEMVGEHVLGALENVTTDAEAVFEQSLRKTTIAEIGRAIVMRAGGRPDSTQELS